MQQFSVYKVAAVYYIRRPNPPVRALRGGSFGLIGNTQEEVYMWRKPEEPKATSPSPEVRESPQVARPTPVIPPSPAPATAIREATPPAGHLTSSLVIKGEITGREDLFIDGEVHGKIHLDEGRVTIGPNGRVTADVEANEIVVRGRVKGNLHGRERVQIRQTGHAVGDVITQRILVEDGAELHGHVEITRIEERRQPNAEQKTAQPVVGKDLVTTVVPSVPQEPVTIA